MKYEIGDIVKNEDGYTGLVCIQWDDGDICSHENDAAHPNPIKTGHWPEDSIPAGTQKNIKANVKRRCECNGFPIESDYCKYCGGYIGPV